MIICPTELPPPVCTFCVYSFGFLRRDRTLLITKPQHAPYNILYGCFHPFLYQTEKVDKKENPVSVAVRGKMPEMISLRTQGRLITCLFMTVGQDHISVELLTLSQFQENGSFANSGVYPLMQWL